MPTRKEVHIDSALSNFAVEYRNGLFVAEQVLPVLPVVHESDKYFKFNREELREQVTERAVGAPANEFVWGTTNDNYSAEEYSLRSLVADRVVRNSDAPIAPKMRTTKKLMNLIKLAMEKRVMNLVTGGSLTKTNPSPKWDGTSPLIESDIDTAKQWISLNSGVIPNSLLMNTEVKDVFKKDSTIRNLIRYTIQGSAGQELLVNGELPPIIFNLRPVIAEAAENTAKEGASASYSRIWPDDVLIWFAEPAPGIESLSLGYMFRVLNWFVKTYRVEERDGEMIQPSVIQDEKLVATEAGYLLDNVLT